MVISDLIFFEELIEVSHSVIGGESLVLSAVNGRIIEQSISDSFEKNITVEGSNTLYSYQSDDSSVILSLPNGSSLSSSVSISTSSFTST